MPQAFKSIAKAAMYSVNKLPMRAGLMLFLIKVLAARTSALVVLARNNCFSMSAIKVLSKVRVATENQQSASSFLALCSFSASGQNEYYSLQSYIADRTRACKTDLLEWLVHSLCTSSTNANPVWLGPL
jgi:hypothetical protein